MVKAAEVDPTPDTKWIEAVVRAVVLMIITKKELKVPKPSQSIVVTMDVTLVNKDTQSTAARARPSEWSRYKMNQREDNSFDDRK